jgi:hypothetical protein
VRADLLRRVRLNQARLLVDHLDPPELVLLACDLLIDGSDAAVALATESPSRLEEREAARLFEDLVRELGLPDLDLATAVSLVAADTCRHLLDGTLPPETAGHRLLVIGHEGAPPLGLLQPLLALLDNSADPAFAGRLKSLARDLLTTLEG